MPIDVSQYAIKRTHNSFKSKPGLLEWKAPTGANAKSHALTNWKPSKSSAKIKVVEGTSPQPGFSKSNYKWSAAKREQYSGDCPFGREEVSADENRSVNSAKPRSLADILAAEGTKNSN